MNITIKKNPKDYDSDDVLIDDRFVGYIGKKDKGVGLIRCPKCKRENYALSVSSGVCCWCGFNLKEELKNENSK